MKKCFPATQKGPKKVYDSKNDFMLKNPARGPNEMLNKHALFILKKKKQGRKKEV